MDNEKQADGGTVETAMRKSIAREVFEALADTTVAMSFEELWSKMREQSATSRSRAAVGEPLSPEELRRWWRQSVLTANALALRRRSEVLLARARTELQMLYLDVHEARRVDDDAPLTIDPVRGEVVEGHPPQAAPAPQPLRDPRVSRPG